MPHSSHALKCMPGHSYTTHISRYLVPDSWPESMILSLDSAFPDHNEHQSANQVHPTLKWGGWCTW